MIKDAIANIPKRERLKFPCGAVCRRHMTVEARERRPRDLELLKVRPQLDNLY